MNSTRFTNPLPWALAASSFGLVLFELALTRLFSVVLFAAFAHLALALALLGIGVGATLQQVVPRLVPSDKLEGRAAWLLMLQGLSTVAATIAIVSLPLTRQWDRPIVGLAERSGVAWDLLDPTLFAAVLPVLVVPFAVVGLLVAAVLQHRRSEAGLLYGFDLVGGAVAALAFLPLLSWFSPGDLAFVVLAVCGTAAALLLGASQNRGFAVAAGMVAVIAGGLCVASASGTEWIRIRYAAGYSEQHVLWTQWTPLARIALHDDGTHIKVLLDNASASEVVVNKRVRTRLGKDAPRTVVHRLHDPPARIAILAASAGPEVAIAQEHGHYDIVAIDIAGVIPELVREQFADAELNPYRDPRVQVIEADGRSAILHAGQPFDIIQMVHANLHSAAGQLANAWSPTLLQTSEAFGTYLDRLTDDGTVSFSAGRHTRSFARSAAEALSDRGIENWWEHILYAEGRGSLLLLKKRKWTQQERDRALAIIAEFPGLVVVNDPLSPTRAGTDRIFFGNLLTDDRPYFDRPGEVLLNGVRVLNSFAGAPDENSEAIDVIYRSLAVQAFVLVLGGIVVLFGPLLLGPSTQSLVGRSHLLLYAAGLGYGYLAVETVLIHELALFVGHPTYAVTVVLFSMLLMSGVGSLLAGEIPQESAKRALRWALGTVLVLGLLQAFVTPVVLESLALGMPLAVRCVLTAVVLAPLGLVMGMPLPLGLKQLREEAGTLVPWAWAINGWTSVVASLGTVMLSRWLGYSIAFSAGLAAYALAWWMVPKLHAVRRLGG